MSAGMQAAVDAGPDGLEDFVAAEDAAARRTGEVQMAARRIAASIGEGYALDPDMARWMVAEVFDALCAGTPPGRALLADLRADAAFWADTAMADEIEAYVAAGLGEIERRAFGRRLRKRLLLTLWRTMPADWQRDFLARVDPQGRWIGAGPA